MSQKPPKKTPQRATPHDINQNTPLSSEEFDALDDFLESVDPDEAMTVSELDGYFCAMLCGPEPVPTPAEYLPAVWGFVEREIFKDATHAEQILGQLARHRRTIASALKSEELYMPVLVKQDDGDVYVADWLIGFLQGMELRPLAWEKLAEDEERGPAMMPIIALLDEVENDHDHDHEHEHEHGSGDGHALTPEQRLQAIELLPQTLGYLYEIFREDGFAPQERPKSQPPSSPQASSPVAKKKTVVQPKSKR